MASALRKVAEKSSLDWRGKKSAIGDIVGGIHLRLVTTATAQVAAQSVGRAV